MDSPSKFGVTVISNVQYVTDIYVDYENNKPAIYLSLVVEQLVKKWIEGESEGVPVGAICPFCEGVWVDKENLPISVMATLPEILKFHVKDSQVINNLNCGRTKTTVLIKQVGRTGADDHSQTLKNTKLTITVDESTDRTTTKFLS